MPLGGAATVQDWPVGQRRGSDRSGKVPADAARTTRLPRRGRGRSETPGDSDAVGRPGGMGLGRGEREVLEATSQSCPVYPTNRNGAKKPRRPGGPAGFLFNFGGTPKAG